MMIDMDAIARVQQHFPQQLIIFYDLAPDQRKQSDADKVFKSIQDFY